MEYRLPNIKSNYEVRQSRREARKETKERRNNLIKVVFTNVCEFLVCGGVALIGVWLFVRMIMNY